MANLNILTKVSSGAHFYDIVAPAGLEAGNAVELFTRNTNATFNVKEPTAITTTNVAISVPVLLPYRVDVEENDYVIATGEVTRAVVPQDRMMLDFPVENVTATATVEAGKYVILDAGTYKMECVASLGGTESVVFQIDRVYSKVGVPMFSMRCIKA